jgi:branched-subunit amino acid transport protein
MTWALILALAVGSYAFKVSGLVVLGAARLPERLMRCVTLLPAALLAALIVVGTFADGQALVLDARAAGVGVAALAAWRRAPFPVVIVLAAAVTAFLRWL